MQQQVLFCKEKSVQLFRVAFFRSDFLQNPYFSTFLLLGSTTIHSFLTFRRKGQNNKTIATCVCNSLLSVTRGTYLYLAFALFFWNKYLRSKTYVLCYLYKYTFFLRKKNVDQCFIFIRYLLMSSMVEGKFIRFKVRLFWFIGFKNESISIKDDMFVLQSTYYMHGSYEWIIMLEKCGRLDLTVFHLIWVIGTYGNWKNQNPGGRFGATS